MKREIKVLVCDKHDAFREGIKTVLSREKDIRVVGATATGSEAIELVKKLRPDVVLLNVSLFDTGNMNAIRRIKKALPKTRILILSMFDNSDVMYRCLSAGAAGYVLKGAPVSQLLSSVRAAGRGQSLAHWNSARLRAGSDQESATVRRLSGREREVLVLLAEGCSYKAIAARLKISVKTVDTHKYNLMRKLKLRSRSELIRYAIKSHLIDA